MEIRLIVLSVLLYRDALFIERPCMTQPRGSAADGLQIFPEQQMSSCAFSHSAEPLSPSSLW